MSGLREIRLFEGPSGAELKGGGAGEVLAWDEATQRWLPQPGSAVTSGAPAPDLASTSNIALSGVVVVDGENTSTGDLVLATEQTDSADEGYWVANDLGPWERPDFYRTDDQVALQLGKLSGAALSGTLNRGLQFYALSGDTIDGPKVWYPARPGAEINVSGAPWFWLPGSNQETIKLALQAYMETLSAANIGGTLAFGEGTFQYVTKLKFPKYWSGYGQGVAATNLSPVIVAGVDPQDSVGMESLANVGAVGYTKLSDMKISNPWGFAAIFEWAPSTVYLLGQYVYPRRCSNVILKCVAVGATGLQECIGELSVAAFIKQIGTSLASAQVLLVPVTGGYLGSFSFKLSADAGVTQSATQATSAGDSQDFIVDDVLGGGTYGPTYGFRISNQEYALTQRTTTALFVQPAVFTTGAPASVVAAVDSSTGFVPGQYVLGTLAGVPNGLWMVVNTPDATHVTLWNVGANGSPAPGANVASGTVLTVCYAPAPRIEVLGTPPAANYLVDIQTVGGPLGSAACQYQYGNGNPAERWKFGLTFGSGPFLNTTAGATWVSPALTGAPGLTLRFHTGLAFNNGTWSYMTPSQTWSDVVGSRVVDNACTWEIVAGTKCLDLTGYFSTIEDLFFDGGTFGLDLNQCEGISAQGNFTYANQRSANIWGKEGSITNSIALNGHHSFFGGFVSMILDGGLGISAAGMLGFQGGPQASMFVAGVDGLNLCGVYLESPGFLFRNSTFFGRNGTGFSIAALDASGGYLGSASSGSTFDFYNGAAISLRGLTLGGSVAGCVGVNTCTNFSIDACRMLGAAPTLDSWPVTGHGFVNENGGTFYEIGATVKSAAPNRSFAIATDTALATDNCGNVTSTGAAAVTVTVPTLPAGTVITYEQGGAGALSFSASGVTIQTALGGAGATVAQYQTRTLFWKSATVVRIT